MEGNGKDDGKLDGLTILTAWLLWRRQIEDYVWSRKLFAARLLSAMTK